MLPEETLLVVRITRHVHTHAHTHTHTHTHTHSVWRRKNTEYLALNRVASIKQSKAVRFHFMKAFTGTRGSSALILKFDARYS